jgi:hypothetical protein
MTRRRQPPNEFNEILSLVARRWKAVAMVVAISLGISGILGYQKHRIYHAIISLEVGTLGVISWEFDKPDIALKIDSRIKTCSSDSVTAEFLMCHFKHANNKIRPMSVPIEDVRVIFRKLHHQYDLKNARKGNVELPHLYKVAFDSNQRSLFIETRGSTVDEALILVRQISNSLIGRHERIFDKHMSYTTTILETINKQHFSSKTKVSKTQPLSTNYQSDGVLAALLIANSLSKPTKVQIKARSIPKDATELLVAIISGLLIGLVVGFLLALLIETIKSFKAFNMSNNVTKK